jgi:hypothetical protein
MLGRRLLLCSQGSKKLLKFLMIMDELHVIDSVQEPTDDDVSRITHNEHATVKPVNMGSVAGLPVVYEHFGNDTRGGCTSDGRRQTSRFKEDLNRWLGTELERSGDRCRATLSLAKYEVFHPIIPTGVSN